MKTDPGTSVVIKTAEQLDQETRAMGFFAPGKGGPATPEPAFGQHNSKPIIIRMNNDDIEPIDRWARSRALKLGQAIRLLTKAGLHLHGHPRTTAIALWGKRQKPPLTLEEAIRELAERGFRRVLHDQKRKGR